MGKGIYYKEYHTKASMTASYPNKWEFMVIKEAIAQLCRELDIDFSTVPVLNLEKLASRQKRNKIAGSGDNR